MLRKRKTIALLVAFIFCLSFIAPAFVAPDTAEASCTYKVVISNTLTPKGEKPWDDVGVIKVELDDTITASDTWVTVSLPSDMKFPGNQKIKNEIFDKLMEAELGDLKDELEAELNGRFELLLQQLSGSEDGQLIIKGLLSKFPEGTTPEQAKQILVTKIVSGIISGIKQNIPDYPVVPVVSTYGDGEVGDGIQIVAGGSDKGLKADDFAPFSIPLKISLQEILESQLGLSITLPPELSQIEKQIELPPFFFITPNNTFDPKLAKTIDGPSSERYFHIYFYGVDLNNMTGDVRVDFLNPSGSGFSFAPGIVIGKSTSTGSTFTTYKDVIQIDDKGGKLDIITIHENSPETLKADKGPIELEILTNGFQWELGTDTQAAYGWTWSHREPIKTGEGGNAEIKENGKILEYDLNNGYLEKYKKQCEEKEPGKLSLLNLGLKVDDSKVEAGGEVEIKVSGGNMTEITIVVANYVAYATTSEEGTTTTLIAGKGDQKLGEFNISEGAATSLIGGRTIKFTLPSGVEWKKKNGKPDYDFETSSGSDIKFKDATISGSDDHILTLTVDSERKEDATKGAKVKFKDFKVNVSPDFSGPIELAVSGSAGATGKIKVAEVVPGAKISVDTVNSIVLGKANQKVADITITEGAAEGIMAGDLVLKLDKGYRWSKEPTVKVVEGTLEIETDVKTDNEVLTIEVLGKGFKEPSKILISDVYIDADRTAPEGSISLEFGSFSPDGCRALYEVEKMNGYVAATADTAADTNKASFRNKSPGKAVIANCVTAAMGETMGNGLFVIGSSTYEVNGVKRVMEVAPYIKNGRTYVPIRYLGYVLGLTDDDIAWDESSKKVAFAKGDASVELEIGSTTITVNGEAQVMDVAPEISNGRTMLPARYVAEAFGFDVGWDEATRTVLISK